MAQDYALRPGTVLHSPERDYTIIKKLGQGGFGITYLVEGEVTVGNITSWMRFAIKEHFIGSLCSREGSTAAVAFSEPVTEEIDRSLRSFIKEATRLQANGLRHPNIVNINEVFQANNTAYYVMEYLGGESLDEYIGRVGPLSQQETEYFLRPIVDAVALLHASRLTHYDIKPQNIILARGRDGVPRPVLIDFGLSKHYDAAGHATSTTRVGGYSPGYSPVEQYSSIAGFSPASDVYALAATAFHCLTGHAPAEAMAAPARFLDEDLAGKASPEFIAVLRSAMAMLVDERIPDAAALAAALFGGGGGAGVPPSRATRPRSAGRPTEPQAIAPTPPETVTPMPPKPSKHFSMWAGVIAVAVIVGAVLAWLALRPSAPMPNDTPESSAVSDTLPAYYEHKERDVTEAPKEDPEPVKAPEENPKPTEDRKPVVQVPQKPYQNLDLQASRGGRNYYFSQDEWAALPQAEKAEYTPKGVVVTGDGLAFVVALNDSGEKTTWDEAMRRYGNSVPTKAQSKVMSQQHDAINRAIIAFGGNKEPKAWYWTRTDMEEDPSYIWIFNMWDGLFSGGNKTATAYGSIYKVLPVARLSD